MEDTEIDEGLERYPAWSWPTTRFHVPFAVDWALTFRQDRFTWTQFLALALKNTDWLWERNQAKRRVLAHVCRTTETPFRDALRRAHREVMRLDIARREGRLPRADRPKKGRGWALPRPWGPPITYDDMPASWGQAYNWRAVVVEVWNAAVESGRFDDVAPTRAAAADPHSGMHGDIAELAEAMQFTDPTQRHTKGGTPGTPDD